jgi:hypothetical protein
MKQQAQRVYQNVPILALDFLACIIAKRANRGLPFPALFTLWASMTMAAGLASRPMCSPHFT